MVQIEILYLRTILLIFVSKLIPIVADKVKLRAKTFVADHSAGALPVSDTIADLERERTC